MPVEVIMPKVDMDMASGRVMTWYAKAGDAVEQGAPLFDIETDKAAMEVEAPASGLLHHLLPEGSEVPIGTPVAWIYAPDEEVGPPPSGQPSSGQPSSGQPSSGEPPQEPPTAEQAAQTEPAAPADPEPAAPAPQPQTGPGAADGTTATAGLRATPKARALARDQAIDLRGISGTGPGGRIQAKDVEACRVAASAAPAPTTGPLAVTRGGGDQGTPLVMLHGFTGDSKTWALLEPHLGQRPLIRIELPGHGASPHLPVRSFADLAAQVRHAFDALDVDQVDLMGHSLGGAVALALADTRAPRLRSLTLLAPAGLGPEMNGDAIQGLVNANQPESLAPWLRALVADEDLISGSFVQVAWSARTDPALRDTQRSMARALFPDGVQAFDLRAALGRLSLPTRIVWGKSDGILPWRHALAAPGPVALHLFDKIGHIPHLENPAAVAALLSAP